jgi:hypothetical protein
LKPQDELHLALCSLISAKPPFTTRHLTIEYAGQHIPALGLLSTVTILSGFRELVKVLQNPPLPAHIEQHHPMKAGTT